MVHVGSTPLNLSVCQNRTAPISHLHDRTQLRHAPSPSDQTRPLPRACLPPPPTHTHSHTLPPPKQEAATAVLQTAKRRSSESGRRLFENFQRLTDQLIK
jgi:hypothetical protein